MHESDFRGVNILSPGAPPRPKVIHIGCAGWNVPRQSDTHFVREGTHLERYSRTFNCCEINSSFYRPHRHSTWERWSESVPKGFRFSVKFPRTITHDVELKCRPEDLTAFLKRVSFLGQQMGPLLVQLPPSCVFDYVVAKRFFALLRDEHDGDVVLEGRHRTWFDAKAVDLLGEFSIAGVAADPACVPAAGHPTGSRKLVYFRLHGFPRRYYSSYSGKFVQAMARRMAALAKESRVWCIFDNTAAGFATPNAFELSEDIARAEATITEQSSR